MKKVIVGGNLTETDLKVKAAIGEDLFKNCKGYVIERHVGKISLLTVTLTIDIDEKKEEE